MHVEFLGDRSQYVGFNSYFIKIISDLHIHQPLRHTDGSFLENNTMFLNVQEDRNRTIQKTLLQIQYCELYATQISRNV